MTFSRSSLGKRPSLFSSLGPLVLTVYRIWSTRQSIHLEIKVATLRSLRQVQKCFFVGSQPDSLTYLELYYLASSFKCLLQQSFQFYLFALRSLHKLWLRDSYFRLKYLEFPGSGLNAELQSLFTAGNPKPILLKAQM
jgi:hypothetical protein